MRIISVFAAVLLAFASFGQQLDSSSKKLKISEWSDPKKATALSLILPGSGQIYNKKIWKAGVVYAGTAGLVYMFKYNTDSLNAYQKELSARLTFDTASFSTNYAILSDNSVKSFRDLHRKYRDYAIVGFVGLYALQAIDANVDAHLKEFRINEDLSMKISPRPLSYNARFGYYSGFEIKLTF